MTAVPVVELDTARTCTTSNASIIPYSLVLTRERTRKYRPSHIVHF